MSARIAVRVEGVSKRYRRSAPGRQLRTLKSALLNRSLIRGLTAEESILALEDVSFEVAAGEAFALVGGNGCGKSTLLKIVAGILKPTTGSVFVDGRLSALIELGAGFHPEISGRENVFINGSVLGLTRREIAEHFDEIVEFAGLEEFIDEPVKHYSSGMYVRLGFAVAVHTRPDVLLVDEVLAVGDEAFAHRCLRRIEELLRQGKTLILVSHSLDLVDDLCDRALWLDDGKPRLLGEPRRVIDAYRQSIAEEEGRQHREEKDREDAEQRPALADADRWGSGEVELVEVRLLGEDGEERYHFQAGEPVTVELTVDAKRRLDDVVFGLLLTTPRGVEVWGSNTELAGFASRSVEGRAVVRTRFPSLRLGPGDYLLDAAAHTRAGAPFDYRRKAASFTMTAPDEQRGLGVYFPQHRWEFSGEGLVMDRARPGAQERGATKAEE